MKKRFALLVLLIVVFSISAFSKCAFSHISFWPPKGTIAANTRIIIELYADAQKFAEKLGKKYPVYLYEFDGKTKTKLTAVDAFVGEFNMTQVIFKLENELKPGTNYYLKIEGLLVDEFENEWFNEEYINDKGEAVFTYNEDAVWVATEADISPPVFNGSPKFVNNTKRRFGCGPAVYSNFTTNCTDNSFIAYRVTLSRSDSESKSTTYYLTPYEINEKLEDNENIIVPGYASNKSALSVGHGMCNGAFNMEYSTQYKAVIQAMDASGNLSEQTWTIEFTSPSPHDH